MNLIAEFQRMGYETLARGTHFDPFTGKTIVLTEEHKARLQAALDALLEDPEANQEKDTSVG